MYKIEKTNEKGVSSIDHNHKKHKRRDTPMIEKPSTNLKLSDLWKKFKTNGVEADKRGNIFFD